MALAGISTSMRVIGLLVYLLQIISYSYTFLVNPGLPDKSMSIEMNSEKTNLKICHRCGIVILPNMKINHCEDCNVCVVGKAS